jgi:hypothetical protein
MIQIRRRGTKLASWAWITISYDSPTMDRALRLISFGIRLPYKHDFYEINMDAYAYGRAWLLWVKGIGWYVSGVRCP